MISPAPIQEALTIEEQKNKVNAPSWVQWLQSLVTAINLLGTNKVKLTPEGDPSVTVAPASGTWIVGDIVRPYTATAGNPKGWVCTVGGTPGTWTSEGNL